MRVTKNVTLAAVVEELKKEKIKSTVINLKLLLLEYNMIVQRLRMRDYKELALKNIKKMKREIEATDWPKEMSGEAKELMPLLEKLAMYIKAEDYIRFQPIQNRVKRIFEIVDEKCAEFTKKGRKI